MTRHLRRWLNDAELRRLGDRYEGIIAAVTEEPIRNKFTATKQLEPVITFDDGHRLVPNITMRKALVGFYGAETDEWIGQRLIVFRYRAERKDPKTGDVIERWEKRVMRADADVAQFERRRRRTGTGE